MHKFFKSEEDRNLWIRLNAERIQYSHKKLNKIDEDLGAIDKPYSHLWVSNNQLDYDEQKREVPRFSLEELSSLSMEELFKLSIIRNKTKILEMFGDFGKTL